MVKRDKMYVNLRNLRGLSWYFIIQGLDQLRDRRLWLVSFVYPFQVSQGIFHFLSLLNYAYIGKISPKYYHNLKWVNKLKGALWRALGLYSSALFETTSSPSSYSSLSISPPLREREGGPRFDVEFERESHAPSNHTTPKADMLIFPFKSDFEIESLIQ